MNYVYGPVPSRRLRVSLGVDIVPKKVCSYDCIYCQIGKTTLQTIGRREYVPVESVLNDVEEALEDWGGKVDYVTISGSGEPTLNSKIGEIVSGIKEMTVTPVAVLTNGSLLYLEKVRRALLPADVVLPSLDACTPEVFQTVNRPHPELTIDRIVEGLVQFRKEYEGEIWVEVLLCRGINDSWSDVEKLKEAFGLLQPDRIQLNTVVRPGTEEYAYMVPAGRMVQIQEALGANAEVIADFQAQDDRIGSKNLEEEVVRLIKRRPVTVDDLCSTLNIHELELAKILEKLTRSGEISYRVFNRRVYYQIAEVGTAPQR
jgi:wyosine [tRNA(Phe)-imidazoG37] synthetase (radical SAM superfamily)